jgi:hypothetical protein
MWKFFQPQLATYLQIYNHTLHRHMAFNIAGRNQLMPFPKLGIKTNHSSSPKLDTFHFPLTLTRHEYGHEASGPVFFFINTLEWGETESTWYVGLSYQPRMIDDDECGAVGGIRIDRRNRSIRRKPAPVPLCQPQIPHDLIWPRTRAAAVGSRRLTDWAMALPFGVHKRGQNDYLLHKKPAAWT